MGIDGRIYPVSALPKASGKRPASSTSWTSGTHTGQAARQGRRPDIDLFETAMLRAKRQKGYFVGFDFSHDALHEIDAFFRREHVTIAPLTVREILDEEIAELCSRKSRARELHPVWQWRKVPHFARRWLPGVISV